MRQAALWIALAVAGCGGDRGTGEPTLQEQYERALGVANPETRAKRLVSVAFKQERAGDSAGAEQSLRQAAESCGKIEDLRGRTRALNSLAYAQGKLGLLSEAKSSLKQVRKAAQQLEDPESKVAALSSMAVTYGRFLGNPTAADVYLREAEAVATATSEPVPKTRGLMEVAYRNHQLDRKENAAGLAAQALEQARAIPMPRQRSDAIACVASRMSMMKMAESQQLFGEALESARAIDSDVSRAHALADIGIRLARAGQTQQAREILKEAESAADQIKDQGLQREILNKIGSAIRRI
jgi:tetratricopeptide (TPR) repeat protein